MSRKRIRWGCDLKRIASVALLLPVAMAGCGVSPERQQALDELRVEANAHLAAAKECCQAPGDYGQAIDVPGVVEVAFSEEMPVKQFAEGRSHFVLLRVPESNSPFVLTTFETMGWVERFGFVWPVVLLLDDKFNVVEKHALDRKDDTTFSQITGYGQRVAIDSRSHKYAVLYTDPALFGRATMVEWPGGTMTFGLKTAYVPIGRMRVVFHRSGILCNIVFDSKGCLVK